MSFKGIDWALIDNLLGVVAIQILDLMQFDLGIATIYVSEDE